MSEFVKIKYCTVCGGDCRSVTPVEGNNKCPYCGHEVYDLSEQKNQEKIEQVVEAKKKVLSMPKLVAITVISTLVVLLGITALFFVLHVDEATTTYVATSGGNKYTKKMEKCYKDKDWDGLFDIIILDCENAIESPYYFAYRTAWFLSQYPEEFDAAYERGDMDRVKEIYDTIKEDYMLRQQDMYYSLYESIDEVEEGLVREYEREKQIMEGAEE